MILDKLLANGDLSKITFTSLDNNPKVKPFEALVNPNSFSLNKTISYGEQTEQSISFQQRYNKHDPPSLSFEILFDATGVIPPKKSKGLDNVPIAGAIAGAVDAASKGFKKEKDAGGIGPQVLAFEKVVYGYQGDLHRSRKVRVTWGNGLVFEGVLTSMSYNFKLFKPDGTPLRATANVTFLANIDDELRLTTINQSSSDLTHQRVVYEGDTLPLMTHRVYGDASLYLKVAVFNKIVSFRNLKAGTVLFFPPLNVLMPK